MASSTRSDVRPAPATQAPPSPALAGLQASALAVPPPVAAELSAAEIPGAELSAAAVEALEGKRRLAHFIYGMHCLSFLGGSGSFLGMILGYANRGAVKDTWLESHYDYQIETFWLSLLLGIAAAVVIFPLAGIPAVEEWLPNSRVILWQLTMGVWSIGRVAKGWTRLYYREPMDTDE